MRNLYSCVLLLSVYLFSPDGLLAQSIDSVVVTGQIRHLSARLYRDVPTVLVSRNNILQANRELVRPAPLNADGTFRVAMPLIYPQEEMYFTYGRISTPFLASAGTVTIDMDADSLFTTAVPFRFRGTNAQVNQQFARYKTFEAGSTKKPASRQLTDMVSGKTNRETFRTIFGVNEAPLVEFSKREKVFPLLNRWVTSINRYNAAAFVNDKSMAENNETSVILPDSLHPISDRLLTAARAGALNQFGNYATQQVTGSENRANSLTVRALAILLERYGKNLTAEERIKLSDYAMANSARQSDLRFFDGLIRRNPDTLQRLVSYETSLQRAIRKFDTASVDFLAAYWLAESLPKLTLNFARLIYGYARPNVKDPALGQSLDELYALNVKDSTRIRTAIQTLRKAGRSAQSLEISPGVFVTRNEGVSGSSLLDKIIDANRGKVLYVLQFDPADAAGQQAALDAQRLRNAFSARDFALVYVPIPENDRSLWPEIATRYSLTGDHLLLSDTQLYDVLERLRGSDETTATIINRAGKITKRNAPLPGTFDEARQAVDKSL